MRFLRRLFLGSPSALPDHDLDCLLVSDTSGAWSHSYTCPECHSPIGHEEFMTCICLTCGGSWRLSIDSESAAFRSVTRGGRWVRSQRTRGCAHLLEADNGRWLAPDRYDEAMRSDREGTR